MENYDINDFIWNMSNTNIKYFFKNLERNYDEI